MNVHEFNARATASHAHSSLPALLRSPRLHHHENNQLSDVSPLASLTNLQWLYLENNQLSPLSKRLYNHKKECERDGSSQRQLFVLAREQSVEL
eukprot:COSAG02_NODE_21936_length_769_cov_3.156716_2_plen_94_part_00